ncbi:MAG TPA: Rieske (2Fe-2S) protein [Candidatus Binatia bacterium]
MMNESITHTVTRRDLLACVAMAAGLIISYGVLGIQGLMFLLPERLRPRTRRLFAGQLDGYRAGGVQVFFDLSGNEILIRRAPAGLTAFDSTCPHLGCRVHWEEDRQRFFCPCHRGVFNPDGVGISGPPAAAGQSLAAVPVEVDEKSGVVYIEVKDIRKRRA